MAATDVVISDLDLYGRTDTSGSIRVHEQDMAISNAMIFFITSKIGDFIYQPTLGGVLDKTLFKLMTTQKTAELRKFFIQVISTNFGALINLNDVNVSPQNDTRTYLIEISYISKLTNNLNLVQFNTKQKVEPVTKNYVDVPYVGENLLNFVLVKLIDLPGVKMVYDDTSGLWTWGPFKFTELVPTQYNFYTIFNIINSN
jgi:hypothetical protein